MSIKIQVIVDEELAAKFRSQARRESKSLSAWVREAGEEMLARDSGKESLTESESLRKFFKKINTEKKGAEPNWEEQKKLILTGYGAKHTS